MNKLNNFAPFFILVFLISIIGISTYKINAKQKFKQEDLSKNIEGVTTNIFSKEDILLPEFSLPDLYEATKDFSNKDLLEKYSIINFFASWCTTCHAEHEALMRLKQEGIVDIYGVAWRDINDNTKAYLEKNGNPFTKIATDNKAIFSKITGIKAVPETLIVDSNGTIVFKYQGNLEEFAIEEIRKILVKN